MKKPTKIKSCTRPVNAVMLPNTGSWLQEHWTSAVGYVKKSLIERVHFLKNIYYIYICMCFCLFHLAIFKNLFFFLWKV